MISTRKDELAELVALLESGEHESAEDLAKAMFVRCADILAQRDGYGVGIGLPTDDVVLPHGPYFNIGDAKRAAEAARERGLRAFVAPLFGAGRALPEVEELVKDQSCVCGHPRALHGERMTTFTGKLKPTSSLGCCVFPLRRKCGCTSYTAA